MMINDEEIEWEDHFLHLTNLLLQRFKWLQTSYNLPIDDEGIETAMSSVASKFWRFCLSTSSIFSA